MPLPELFYSTTSRMASRESFLHLHGLYLIWCCTHILTEFNLLQVLEVPSLLENGSSVVKKQILQQKQVYSKTHSGGCCSWSKCCMPRYNTKNYNLLQQNRRPQEVVELLFDIVGCEFCKLFSIMLSFLFLLNPWTSLCYHWSAFYCSTNFIY